MKTLQFTENCRSRSPENSLFPKAPISYKNHVIIVKNKLNLINSLKSGVKLNQK